VRVLSRGRKSAAEEDADPEFERELAELLREPPAAAPGGGGAPSADGADDQVRAVAPGQHYFAE
jgi:hypothetical protein